MEEKRNPTAEIIDRIQTEVRRWVKGFSELDLHAFARGEWVPPVDLFEEPDRLVLYADLPGLDSKDVTLTLSSDSLILEGEKKAPAHDALPALGERKAGPFRRVLALPFAVNGKEVKAQVKNGVLEMTLPRVPPSDEGEINIPVT